MVTRNTFGAKIVKGRFYLIIFLQVFVAALRVNLYPFIFEDFRCIPCILPTSFYIERLSKFIEAFFFLSLKVFFLLLLAFFYILSDYWGCVCIPTFYKLLVSPSLLYCTLHPTKLPDFDDFFY